MVKITLTKHPKNPIIIESTPGFGLVGTIAAEFLIDHLDTEMIGEIWFEKMPAITAIHEESVVQPLGLFYNKKYNVIIVHAITGTQGIEWKLGNAILEVAKKLKAKEIICLEGVGNPSLTTTTEAFFYSSNPVKKKILQKIGINPLKEGIIMGVTSALLLKHDEIPLSCIFAEASSNMPDSKAAAKIIETLDKYLGLKVDYKPLLQQAAKFEEKLKGILSKSEEAQKLQEKKKLSYVG